MTAPNPLIAERQDSTTWYSGLGIVESVNDIAHGIESASWIDSSLGIGGAGLDTLGVIVDPVGTVFAWGVSWLIEHLEPLSEALDSLAGDPDQIAANSKTWHNVATHVTWAATDLRDTVLRDIDEWSGPAAEAYRFTAQEQYQVLQAVSRAAAAIGNGIHLTGLLVAAVREVVRDLIAECVATLAVRLPMWLAEVGVTFGAGTPWVTGQVAVLIAKWVKRIGAFLEALINSLRRLGPLLSQLDELIAALHTALRRMTRQDPLGLGHPRGPDHDGDGRPDAFDPDHHPFQGVDFNDPRTFDPQVLYGRDAEDVRAAIPSDWQARPSDSGGGMVYEDPNRRGRQIRIMPGYIEGNRPDPVTHGPYVVVCQNGVNVKLPLHGNPTLAGEL